MVQDGRFNVEISTDGMIARGTFVPAVGDGHALNLEEIDYELRANGVIQGINLEALEKALEICNGQKKVVRDMVLARGIPSRPGIPEVFVFHPKIQALDPAFLPPEKLAHLKKGDSGEWIYPENAAALGIPVPEQLGFKAASADEKVDFRETRGLFIIHDGQLLAARRNAVEGIAGQTVRGEYVPFKDLEVNQMDPGKNVEIRDGHAYATKNGRFVWSAHSYWVEEILELEQINYKTGNIHFPGNLVLKAGIKDGFKIWVGGNIEAAGVMDAYEIYCGGNMVANGGIIGRGKGLIRSRGGITTRFAEHCDIEALGPIHIENTSLNSLIYTLDTLKTGEKGKIVGGHVQARAGMEVTQIGNAAGAHTEVSVGENYVMHRKLEFVREKFQTIAIAVQRLEERVKTSHEPSLVQQFNRLNAESQRYQAMMVEILSEINDFEQATLTVTGTVFPGVVVEICRVPLTITKELKGVRFFLNKDSGKVTVENLAAAKAAKDEAAKAEKSIRERKEDHAPEKAEKGQEKKD